MDARTQPHRKAKSFRYTRAPVLSTDHMQAYPFQNVLMTLINHTDLPPTMQACPAGSHFLGLVGILSAAFGAAFDLR
jgi:hypothetical protein